jgi:hypothetical protein
MTGAGPLASLVQAGSETPRNPTRMRQARTRVLTATGAAAAARRDLAMWPPSAGYFQRHKRGEQDGRRSGYSVGHRGPASL